MPKNTDEEIPKIAMQGQSGAHDKCPYCFKESDAHKPLGMGKSRCVQCGRIFAHKGV